MGNENYVCYRVALRILKVSKWRFQVTKNQIQFHPIANIVSNLMA
jgi:hypothetical protein